MEGLKTFVAENPQVSAAMITAACGILGIFINIGINIFFRNRDYKNKNKMRLIENMELYYLPLRDKIEYTRELVSKLSENGEINLYNILDGNMGASYAQRVKLFKESLEELHKNFNGGLYKFQDDYKLFISHRKVKNKVWELCQYSEKRIKNSDVSSLNDLLKELEELFYRIQRCEVRIMIDCFWNRLWKYFLIWKNYKKKK